MITLKVNGTTHHLKIDEDTPLLWVLRDHLGLVGTKYSCGIAECGNCLVHIDGKPELSCTTSAKEAEGTEITTIEGLKGKIADVLRRVWIEEEVPQCGYCQSGQIMAAASLLEANPNPNDDEINEAMSDVLCRCGTYPAIRRGIHKAARGK